MLKVTSFKEHHKGSVRGFLSVESDKMYVKFNNLRLMQTAEGKLWIAMPSQEYKDKDGKNRYSPYIQFTNKKVEGVFYAQVLKALEEYRKNNKGKNDEEEVDFPY